jgi:hypothetical protein
MYKTTRIWPEVAVTERSTTFRERPAKLRLDTTAPLSAVEGLGGCVLVEHPQMQRCRGLSSEKSLRGLGEQA